MNADALADLFAAALDPAIAWMDDALCAQVDPEIFFPETGGSNRAAKRTCASCEVREECLEYALDRDERFGVWAGLTVDERDAVRLWREAEQAPDQLAA